MAAWLLLVGPAAQYGGGVLPVLAMAGRRKDVSETFLEAYPAIFKFCLFWWCVFVVAVMAVYISDHLFTKYFGPARVDYSVSLELRGSSDREAYWAQLVDPSKWSPSHPVLASANVRMVECTAKGKDAAKGAAKEEPAEGEEEGPSKALRPVALGPLRVGLGLTLRHKDNAGDARAGSFFCTRECTVLEKPKDGPWRLEMRTIEVGAGYPYLRDTEESVVEVWPASEDGSVRCELSGGAATSSRVFRWWSGLQRATIASAEGLLLAIDEELGKAKKKD
eukprot:TRINITY_DN20554_c0_g2_i1.p1 TRINITY_DN20554_c0_g2~~TRINITY_DN20554_c0_g2_i1.p1  ORF type:complete len:326 (-),score=73.45 TRINITY_DN20554_c0_g2_i1:1088-1921(-)